jgi:hypothetical protein
MRTFSGDDLSGHPHRNSGKGSEPKSALWIEPLEQEEDEGGNLRRSRISITSKRIRLLDPDNLCVKYIIDALRYCEVIQDDTTKEIEVYIKQEKVKKRKEEKTIIEVE